MTFHKAAIDVITKGLDPKHPHRDLGHDGLLITTPVKQEVASAAVVPVFVPSVFLPEETIPATITSTTVELVSPTQTTVVVDATPSETAIAYLEAMAPKTVEAEEEAPQQTAAVTEETPAKPKRVPPGRKPKTQQTES